MLQDALHTGKMLLEMQNKSKLVLLCKYEILDYTVHTVRLTE